MDPFRTVRNRRCEERKDCAAAAVGMPSGCSQTRKPEADIHSADGSYRFRSRSEPPAIKRIQIESKTSSLVRNKVEIFVRNAAAAANPARVRDSGCDSYCDDNFRLRFRLLHHHHANTFHSGTGRLRR